MNKTKFTLILIILLVSPLILFSQRSALEEAIPLPDSLARIDSIKIKGNNTTKDYVILRELTFKEGDTVSTRTLEFNRERVFSLGLFNDVRIALEKGVNGSKAVIEVEESWYIYPIPFLRFKDGESSKSSYGVNLLYRNFLGRDETIRANLAFGYDPSFTFNYNIPVLFSSKKLGLGFLFNYSTFVNKTNEGIRLNNGDYDYKGVISRVYLNYRMNQFNLLVTTIGYEYFEAPEKKFKSITASDGRIDRFPMAGIDYIYDSRDLKQYAAEGTFFNFGAFHKGFGVNNINYNILDVDLREYQHLIDDLTWKGRFTSRTMVGENLPLYDYSLLGYDETIRGASKKKFDGKTYILTSTELSYPLVKEWDMKLKLPLLPESLTSARIGIQFTLFADAGSAFDDFSDFSYHNFTYGWGFGINFLILPYNGFRIEYAFDKNMKGEVLIASGFSF
jgi:outer membrane protein assembly factor BamA